MAFVKNGGANFEDMRKNDVGEYFADFDEKTALWCVFHTDRNTGFAYSSWADQKSAEIDARRRNVMTRHPEGE